MLFQQLRNFVVAAECGSINQAAERLFISQQALRSSINSFEEQVGFPLFIRSPRGIQLTRAGQAVLEDAERILTIADGWKEYNISAQPGEEVVTVLASTVICNTVITDVIKECRAKYPHLRILFFHTRDDEMMETMTSRSIGVLGSAPESVIEKNIRPFAERIDVNLDVFGMDRFCIYLNTRNPLAQQEYLTCDQLKSLTLAAYPGEDERFFYRSVYRCFNDAPPIFIEKQENIFQIISEMDDVAAVFPHMAAYNNIYVDRGAIKGMDVKNRPMPGLTCMMYPKKGLLTPGQRVVVMMLQERMKELIGRMHEDLPMV